MSITERLQFIISASGADAAKEFRQLGSTAEAELSKVDGVSKKGNAALSFLKTNAAELAVAGGAAIGAFVAKAAGEFQNLALATGQFSDATGISTEAASRWIEVAGDLGIETGKVEGAIRKMEKAAGTTPAVFDRFGVSIARTSSGALDANETFLRTIERLNEIKDPADRAAAGTALLGKSWADLGEIINSADVRGQLDAVSDAKVIDDAEVAKAREFRDTWDELKTKLEDFALTVGGAVIPALTDVLDLALDLSDALSTPFDIFGKTLDAGRDSIRGTNEDLVNLALAAADDLDPALRGAADRYAGLASAFSNGLGDALAARDAVSEVGEAADESAGRLDDLRNAYKELLGQLDQRQGYLSLLDTLDDLEQAGREAFDAAATGAEDAAEKARDYEQASLGAQEELLKWLNSLGTVPTEVATEIQALIDEGEYAKAERRLALLERTRTVSVQVQTGQTSASSFLNPAEIARALGPNFSLPMQAGDISQSEGGRGLSRAGIIRPRSGSNVIDASGMFAAVPAAPRGPFAEDILSNVDRLANASAANQQAQSSVRGLLNGLADAEVAFMQGEASAQDWSDAQFAAYRAAMTASRSAVELARAQADLDGKTLSAKEAAEIQRAELDKFSFGLAPDSELRKNLTGYIELLGKVASGQEGTAKATEDALKKAEELAQSRTKAALEQARADLEASRATSAVAASTNELVAALFSKATTAEEAQQKMEAVARAEQSLVDAVLAEADALAEQQRVSAASRGVTLSDAQMAALRLATIEAEASKLLPGNARSALDQFAGTLRQAVNISLNVNAADPLAGAAIFETLDREFRRRGLGGLGQAA